MVDHINIVRKKLELKYNNTIEINKLHEIKLNYYYYYLLYNPPLLLLQVVIES